jgi:hypothetical protein
VKPGTREPRVLLHIGAPKTGSTFLQGMLWANREALRTAGVAVPGVGAFEHFRASRDIRGAAFDPDEPGGIGTGAWDLLVHKALHRSEPVVVLSDEQLAALTVPQIERAVASLYPREVHIVYVVRELTSLLPSSWQEVVKHRGTLSYPDWARSVLRGRNRTFWNVQDVPTVLQRWGSKVPPERQHVITMPRPAAGHDELWRRFASVLGIDADVADRVDVVANRSLGLAATEVLRHVNSALPSSFERWQYTTLVQDLLAAQIWSAAEAPSPPALPRRLRPLVADQQARIIAGIEASGCDVIGPMSDLQPSPAVAASPQPPDAELLDVAVRGITGLLSEMAHRQEQSRRAPGTRLLEALVRRDSVGRMVTALEGRSSQLDAVLMDRARVARERIRGKAQS